MKSLIFLAKVVTLPPVVLWAIVSKRNWRLWWPLIKTVFPALPGVIRRAAEHQ